MRGWGLRMDPRILCLDKRNDLAHRVHRMCKFWNEWTTLLNCLVDLDRLGALGYYVLACLGALHCPSLIHQYICASIRTINPIHHPAKHSSHHAILSICSSRHPPMNASTQRMHLSIHACHLLAIHPFASCIHQTIHASMQLHKRPTS